MQRAHGERNIRSARRRQAEIYHWVSRREKKRYTDVSSRRVEVKRHMRETHINNFQVSITDTYIRTLSARGAKGYNVCVHTPRPAQEAFIYEQHNRICFTSRRRVLRWWFFASGRLYFPRYILRKGLMTPHTCVCVLRAVCVCVLCAFSCVYMLLCASLVFLSASFSHCAPVFGRRVVDVCSPAHLSQYEIY